MKKDRFFTAVYCPPYPPKNEYPNRITDVVYGALKDIGVDNIFGHFEDNYGWNYLTDAMDICDRLDLTYFPRLNIYQQYLAITGGYSVKNGVTYTERSEAEQKQIDEEFLRQIDSISAHKCFGGIYFGDENAYDAIPGIAKAKSLFKAHYPDKEFHYNNLNYSFGDDHLFGGVHTKNYKVLTGDMACKSENRFNRYRYLIDRYVAEVDPEYLTTDLYPFAWTWKEIPTSVHRGLYEINGFFAEYKKKRPGMKSFTYLQVGCLETPTCCRVNTRAEMALQMNVTLAYGHEGFAFFPGVYPNDFLGECDLGKGGICGLIDAYGRETMYADMARSLLKDVQACAPVMLDSEFLGVATVGEFHGGFDGVDIGNLSDNDAIYTGGPRDFVLYEGSLPSIETTSQLFIGVFRQSNGKKAYYLVNNSVVSSSKARVRLEGSFRSIQNATETAHEKEANFYLPAGESVLIYE